MCGIDYNVEQHNPKENVVGVKVSQFSFNRLKGADILLDVEMKSTGEVACFGNNKHEAYIKALESTGFEIPNITEESASNNILLSIATYKFKNEMLPSARVLCEMGFNIYCTHNTSEFLKEHHVENTELRLYSKNDDVEDTIMKWISQKKFNMIINVSERNKIRSEEDQYTDGYKLRRMAVESGIPIVTDVKCAKLLISSMKWKSSVNNQNKALTVRPQTDCFTTYKVVRIPGLIDVHVHVREPGDEYKEDWESCSKAAIAGGITTIFAMPNTNPAIIDEKSLELVEKMSHEKSYCDYGLYLGASSSNTQTVSKLSDRSVGLKMYLNNTYGPLLLENVLDWSEHIKNWPSNRVICAHAESTTLAAILHIANIHNRHIHICHVSSKEEITIIRESKKNGQNVTCEVAPHHLFLNKTNLNSHLRAVKPPLGHNEDVNALWENLEYIDCFATDHAPHTLKDKYGSECADKDCSPDECKDCSKRCPGFGGLETALPLLLTAVKERRLTLDDIILRYHTNPKNIFGIPDDPNTYIEVDMDDKFISPSRPKYSKCDWSPFNGRELYGSIKRVVIRGKLVAVDGNIIVNEPFGKNIADDISISPTVLGGGVSGGEGVSRRESISGGEGVLNDNSMLEESFDAQPAHNYTLEILQIRDKLKLHHILSASQFDRDKLRIIFELADVFKKMVEQNTHTDMFKGKTMASIFYEPSTRTRCSFSAAMQKLGGNVIDISSDKSSVQKGETTEDFLRCMQCYADVLVLRSNVKNSATNASKLLDKPLINAGDGDGEHPTQAILDMYTIREEMGTTGGNICVTLYGDLKYGRTVHSLCALLALRPREIRLRFVSPDNLRMPDEIKEYLESKDVEFSEHDALTEVIENTDILYVTRIQKERLLGEDLNSESKGLDNITPQILCKAKKSLRIMHPLPRVDEISVEIDSDPRAAYFRQMQNGLYVRMALLALVL